MLNIGIIGLGNIAVRVAKGIHCVNNANLYAVASRGFEKANEFKIKNKAEFAYGSYEELLRDPSVDLVYICTPNPLHYEHIMMCLSFHKHVVCEKPFVTNAKQLTSCFDYAKDQGCFLMEAEKTLFTPLNQKIKAMVDDGAIGNIRYIEAGYCAKMEMDHVKGDSWLFRKEDGGSFYDVGVYPICYANYFSNACIQHMQIMKQNKSDGCVDVFAQAMLGYENGVMAYVRSSWDLETINKGFLYGTDGVIVTENFWKGTKAELIKNGISTTIEVAMESDFAGEIEHAVTCIENGQLQSSILSYENSKEILKVLEEMHTCNCVSVEKSVK